MLKPYKKTLLITSLLCLLPALAGIYLWRQLPDTIVTHWGLHDEPNGYMSKTMVVFGLPLLMLALQWICVFGILLDPKRKNHSKKLTGMVFWICPLVSVWTHGITYGYAMGAKISIGTSAIMLVSILFLITGNYLPKCRQNYTMGIRLPWTLASEGNWISTHRFAGKVWVAGSIVLLLSALLISDITIVAWVGLGILVLLTLLPVLYSLGYYKKHQ